jgi:hypothetical protein
MCANTHVCVHACVRVPCAWFPSLRASTWGPGGSQSGMRAAQTAPIGCGAGSALAVGPSRLRCRSCQARAPTPPHAPPTMLPHPRAPRDRPARPAPRRRQHRRLPGTGRRELVTRRAPRNGPSACNALSTRMRVRTRATPAWLSGQCRRAARRAIQGGSGSRRPAAGPSSAAALPCGCPS